MMIMMMPTTTTTSTPCDTDINYNANDNANGNNREVKHDVYGKRQTAKIILILLTFSLALK